MSKDKEYLKQRRVVRKSLLGREVKGRKIVTKVGQHIDTRVNALHLVPVQLSDGTFRVFYGVGGGWYEYHFSDNVIRRAVERSAKMPVVCATSPSRSRVQSYKPRKGVSHAVVTVYNGEQEGRSDEICFHKEKKQV